MGRSSGRSPPRYRSRRSRRSESPRRRDRERDRDRDRDHAKRSRAPANQADDTEGQRPRKRARPSAVATTSTSTSTTTTAAVVDAVDTPVSSAPTHTETATDADCSAGSAEARSDEALKRAERLRRWREVQQARKAAAAATMPGEDNAAAASGTAAGTNDGRGSGGNDDSNVLPTTATAEADDAVLEAASDDDDGDNDDIQNAHGMDVDQDDNKAEEDAEDPLDAFMASLSGAVKQSYEAGADVEKLGDDDDEFEYSTRERVVEDVHRKMKKELPKVDHSKEVYQPFRRNFYIEVPEIAALSDADVREIRRDLDGIKIRGKDCPKPIKAWTQVGILERVLDVMLQHGYRAPTPIQCQALPAIMSGRDVIGVAKTGSGKTLAFVVPMMRHVLDQPKLGAREGPIAVVMAPTRELAVQIHQEVRLFCRPLNLRAACVYGGTGISDQIAELKRGAEIVVATPGRFFDMLTLNNGRVTNLRRVTYVVLDEADRMFDMGFMPQVQKILNNTRPDRQTVMFSATFPRSVEQVARSILHRPVEIIVGGRSVVCNDVKQVIEVVEADRKFLRLLKLLGDHVDTGKALVFVNRQAAADLLYRDLIKVGYACVSLHGAQDQMDRASTLQDFKRGVCNLMIATSVAARGLDVKSLDLVVNYETPTHVEDYVHRCGRTGRNGAKGTAVTFIQPDEEHLADVLVKGLRDSKVDVPADLMALYQRQQGKLAAGTATQTHSSGFGGRGFKFTRQEDDKIKAERKALSKGYTKGADVEVSDDDDDDDADAAMSEDEDGRPKKPQAKLLFEVSRFQGSVLMRVYEDGTRIETEESDTVIGSKQAADAAAAAIANATTAASATSAASAAAVVVPVPGVPKLVPVANDGAAPALLPLPSPAAAAAASPPASASTVDAPTDAKISEVLSRISSQLAAPASRGTAPSLQPVQPQSDGLLAQPESAEARAAQIAARLAEKHGKGKEHMRAAAAAAAATSAKSFSQARADASRAGGVASHYQAELNINTVPKHVRWRFTKHEGLFELERETSTTMTTRGEFVEPGKKPSPGQRELYMMIEGKSVDSVATAGLRIWEIIKAEVAKGPPVQRQGKYSVG